MVWTPKIACFGVVGGLYLLWLFGLFSLASHSFNELPLVSFSHSLFLWLIIGKLSCGIIDATGLCLSKIEAAVIVSYNFWVDTYFQIVAGLKLPS